MTHVRTSPFYPQSNGKIERWHQSLKGECIRPGVPLSTEDAGHLVARYIDHYNRVRLRSTIGYVAPPGQVGRARVPDFCRTRPQTTSGTSQAPTPPSGGVPPTRGSDWRLPDDSVKPIPPCKTEAGSAGEQPCRGITRWAHHVDEVGGVRAKRLRASAPPTRAQTSSNDGPPCLENSRRAAAEFSSLFGTGLSISR